MNLVSLEGVGMSTQANKALVRRFYRSTIDLMLAEDDLVMARVTVEGTNTGPWGATPPTGKHASFSLVNIFRIANGKVVEIWNHRDDLGLMQQLGAPIHAGSSR
jgi:predicted ester cyclase